MPPQKREKPNKYAPPQLPGNPGDLPGCSNLENLINLIRTELEIKQRELGNAAEKIKDWQWDCNQERAGGLSDTGNACKKYLEALADYNDVLTQYNIKLAEYNRLANEYSTTFPACPVPTCNNNQTPNGKLPPSFDFPKLADGPNTTSYINSLNECKNKLKTEIAQIIQKIAEKEACLAFIQVTGRTVREYSGVGGMGKAPSNYKIIDIDMSTQPPIFKFIEFDMQSANPEYRFPNNLNNAISITLNNIQKNIQNPLLACNTWDPPVPPVSYPSRNKKGLYDLDTFKAWMQNIINMLIDYVNRLKQDIDELNRLKKCKEKLSEDGGLIDQAISSMQYVGGAENLHTINQSIQEICLSLAKIEVTEATITFTIANQPATQPGGTIVLKSSPSLSLNKLVNVDRKQNIATVNIAEAEKIITSKNGSPNTCPPTINNKGKWTYPVNVSVNIKQSIDPNKLKEALDKLIIKIGKKIDCTKDCPSIQDSDDTWTPSITVSDATTTITGCAKNRQ
jgi:hypothetical protein